MSFKFECVGLKSIMKLSEGAFSSSSFFNKHLMAFLFHSYVILFSDVYNSLSGSNPYMSWS